MANLSIRNLTPEHEQTLTNIRRKYGRGCNTASGAIAKALEDWERLQTTNAALEKRLDDAMDIIREYSKASLSAGEAMVRDSLERYLDRIYLQLVKRAKARTESATLTNTTPPHK